MQRAGRLQCSRLIGVDGPGEQELAVGLREHPDGLRRGQLDLHRGARIRGIRLGGGRRRCRLRSRTVGAGYRRLRGLRSGCGGVGRGGCHIARFDRLRLGSRGSRRLSRGRLGRLLLGSRRGSVDGLHRCRLVLVKQGDPPAALPPGVHSRAHQHHDHYQGQRGQRRRPVETPLRDTLPFLNAGQRNIHRSERMRGQELRPGVRFDHLLHVGGMLVVIQPEKRGVLAHEALGEHTSGELVESFVFDRLQKSRRDFQARGRSARDRGCASLRSRRNVSPMEVIPVVFLGP